MTLFEWGGILFVWFVDFLLSLVCFGLFWLAVQHEGGANEVWASKWWTGAFWNAGASIPAGCVPVAVRDKVVLNDRHFKKRNRINLVVHAAPEAAVPAAEEIQAPAQEPEDWASCLS